MVYGNPFSTVVGWTRDGPEAGARRSWDGCLTGVRRACDGRMAVAPQERFFWLPLFLFAPTGATVAGMSASKPNTMIISASELRELEARAFAGRSDVYRYLRKNHPHLLTQKVGTGEGPSWADIATILSKRGYVGSRGGPLNGHAVRRVFRRVERDLRRKEVAAANQPNRPAPPSRQHPDWQPPLADTPRTGPALPYRRDEPEEVLPPRRPAPLPPSQASPAKAAPLTINDMSPEARAKIERVRQQLREDDRKRFGHWE